MKTFVSNLFAASTLTAFIATSIPSVSAVALSPAPHVARHLNLAHMAKVKRNAHKKRCKARTTPQADPGSGGGSTTNNNGGSGGTVSNSGGSSGGGGAAPAGSPFAHKKGLAWPNGCSDIMKWNPGELSWQYNWRATPYSDCPNGSPLYVPMVWGWNQVGDFAAATSGTAPPVIFSLNEPNLCGSGLSSCVSPGDAATIYWQYIAPLRARGTLVGSSATTNAPDGIQWEQQFRQAIGQRGSDFLCLHYYDLTSQGAIDYANGWHAAFPGEGVVFTEIGCQNFSGDNRGQCNSDMVNNFISEFSHWCETTDWCWGYTFFGAMLDLQNVNYDNQLMNPDYSPNDKGWRFLTSF